MRCIHDFDYFDGTPRCKVCDKPLKSFTPKMKTEFLNLIRSISDIDLSRLYDAARHDLTNGSVLRSLAMQREIRERKQGIKR